MKSPPAARVSSVSCLLRKRNRGADPTAENRRPRDFVTATDLKTSCLHKIGYTCTSSAAAAHLTEQNMVTDCCSAGVASILHTINTSHCHPHLHPRLPLPLLPQQTPLDDRDDVTNWGPALTSEMTKCGSGPADGIFNRSGQPCETQWHSGAVLFWVDSKTGKGQRQVKDPRYL